jgi:hypothetical protein
MTLKEVPTSQYTRFIRWLKKKHPLKKKGVKVEVELVDKPSVPFRSPSGKVEEAEATISILPQRTLIRIAVGKPSKTLRDILSDCSHEWCHVLQYHDRGVKFEEYAHRKYWENPLEQEAKSFALTTVRDYIKEMGLNSK